MILCMLALTLNFDPPAAKKDLDQIQGTWTMEALEVEGKLVPAEKLRGTTLVIKGDQYTTVVKDKKHTVKIELDPAQKPKAIDMHFPDGPDLPKLSKGIYEIDGDTLRICRAQATGQERPRQFVTETNTGLFIVTWKRMK